MTWKYFLHSRPLCRNPPFTSGFPSQSSSDAKVRCLLCCWYEQFVEQSVNSSATWSAFTRMQHHCNNLILTDLWYVVSQRVPQNEQMSLTISYHRWIMRIWLINPLIKQVIHPLTQHIHWIRHPFHLRYHDDVIKWKHLPRYWPFVQGIHRSPVNSLHKGQWHGALMFSLICVWINHWVNNREAGDLRCCLAHFDVIVIMQKCPIVHHHTLEAQQCLDM